MLAKQLPIPDPWVSLSVCVAMGGLAGLIRYPLGPVLREGKPLPHWLHVVGGGAVGMVGSLFATGTSVPEEAKWGGSFIAGLVALQLLAAITKVADETPEILEDALRNHLGVPKHDDDDEEEHPG